jgi:DNA-binding NtrC family response regulator
MKTKTTKRGKKIIEADDKGMAFAQPLLMKHRILVADDDSSIRDIFKIILVRAGYDLELKEDANEIFNNNFKIPDLFLIDKLLSGVDGLELCRYLKDNPDTCNIPVIMVSASPDIGVSAIKAGADDFIEKPFELTYLLKVIERNINSTKNENSLRRTRTSQGS